MNFSEALEELKIGSRLARKGWNGKGMWIKAQYPGEHGSLTLPFVLIRTADGNHIPWTVSQADLFAEDWEIAI